MTEASNGEAAARPEAPAPGACSRCGGESHGEYLEAMHDREGRRIAGGYWIDPEPECKRCRAQAAAAQVDGQRTAKLRELIAKAGFSPIHHDMEIANLRGDLSPAFAAAIHDAVHSGRSLYLFGLPGRGKSHAAAGILKQHLAATLQPGYFRKVPELFVELRDAVRRHYDDEVLAKLSCASALVLDDLGVERVTDYSLDRLYILIERWASDKKNRLVITSNLSPGELSKRLDERIVSRIVGMCRIVEVVGEDHRLRQGRNE